MISSSSGIFSSSLSESLSSSDPYSSASAESSYNYYTFNSSFNVFYKVLSPRSGLVLVLSGDYDLLVLFYSSSYIPCSLSSINDL